MINLMGPSLSFSFFLLRLSFCLFCLYAFVCLSLFLSFCIIFFVLIYLCLLVSLHHFSSHYFNLSVFLSVLSVFFILPVSLYLPFPSFSSVSYTFHSPWNVSQELSRNISPFFCHFISNYHFFLFWTAINVNVIYLTIFSSQNFVIWPIGQTPY